MERLDKVISDVKGQSSAADIIEFKAVLQENNRLQVPVKVRWLFQLEPSQLWLITVKLGIGIEEQFYGRMDKSGRITVPKLTINLLSQTSELETLKGQVFEVSMEKMSRDWNKTG